jgi:Xaa-Pro dipeptidase
MPAATDTHSSNRIAFAKHIETLRRRLERILIGLPFDGVVFHSGEPHYYFCDDHAAPFRPNPHFAHWTPLNGAGHVVVARPDQAPRLIAHVPEDFWYEPVSIGQPFWIDAIQVSSLPTEKDVVGELGSVRRLAFIGESNQFAQEAGFEPAAVNPAVLVNRLNWHRSYKTQYEVDCIRQATKRAAAAHRAARAAFEQRASELEIHYAYVRALQQVDSELPFESIVALDEKGSFLHYVHKRVDVAGRVLLIDNGASFAGYAADITRTWASSAADSLFRQMLDDFHQVQQKLCQSVRAGLAFIDLHESAHRAIGQLLSNAGILRVPADQAFDRGLTRPFFPHGLGHFLGIQVHDVAGRQTGPDEADSPPPPLYPFLRTTRTLEPDQVVTIEPGIYFIEMLLRPFRTATERDAIDWSLIDRLKSHGGMRIEDNVVVTDGSNVNITREFLPE